MIGKKQQGMKSYRVVYNTETEEFEFFRSIHSTRPVTSLSLEKVNAITLFELRRISQKLNLSGTPEDLTSLRVSLIYLQNQVAKS